MTNLGAAMALCALCMTNACVKVPAFEQKDAAPSDGPTSPSDAPTDSGGSSPAVYVEQNGNDINAVGPGYSMRFSTTGSRFPYQLNVGGNFFLGGSQQCNDEQGMGIALYPVQRVNAVGSSDMGTPTVSVPLDGPWVAQVRVAWSTSYLCSSGSGSFTGHSTFSYFPNGRLARFDVIDSQTARASADCVACAGAGSPFVLASYTTLIVDNNAYLSDGNLAALDAYGETVSNPGRTACVRQRGQSIAFSWVDAQNRLRVVDDAPSRTIAFVKDIFSGASVAVADYATTTQMGISASEDCGTLENRISPFSDADHELTINGSAVGAALTDGIFGGDPRPSGYPVTFPVTIRLSATVTPRVPAGFAVWLYHNPMPADLTLTHSAAPAGTWYRLQRVGQDQLVIWFDVALENSETITITANP